MGMFLRFLVKKVGLKAMARHMIPTAPTLYLGGVLWLTSVWINNAWADIEKPGFRSDSAQALALLDKGRMRIQTNLDSSWYYIHQAIKISRTIPNKRILTKAYNLLATTYVVTGEAEKGLAILRQAEQLSRPYPFDSIRLEVLVRMVQLHRVQGNYQQALQSGLALDHDLEKRKERKAVIVFTLYTELAIIHQQLAIDSLVLPYYQRAYRVALGSRDKRLLLAGAGNLGEYYVKHQLFSSGEQYLKKSLAISQELRFDHSIAENMRNLGELNRHQHRYWTAIAYYKRGLAIQQRIGAKEFIGYIYLHLAQSYAALANHTLALGYLKKSIALFTEIRSAPYLHQALLAKVKIEQQQGNFKEALQTMEQAQALGDSLVGLDKQKAIAQIQARFDLERKQNQITNLKKDLRLQQQARQTIQLQLNLTQHQLLFLIALFLLLLLFVSVVYLNFSKLKQAQQQLQQQKQEIQLQANQLLELNQTKDQLFSIISHDLRSPLVRLKQDIHQLLVSVGRGEKISHPFVRGLDQKTDNLLALLMTLFDWAYIQFSGFQTNLEDVDLNDAIAQASSYLTDRVQQKQLTLITQIEKDVTVRADRQQLGVVLRNLLDNAIKFTPENGYIRLLTIGNTDTVDFQVRDTGIGMTSAMVDQLFTQPCVRQGTQGEVGTGLGMKIIQELLSKQNASLSVESQPNKGTTIHVRLLRSACRSSSDMSPA